MELLYMYPEIPENPDIGRFLCKEPQTIRKTRIVVALITGNPGLSDQDSQKPLQPENPALMEPDSQEPLNPEDPAFSEPYVN